MRHKRQYGIPLAYSNSGTQHSARKHPPSNHRPSCPIHGCSQHQHLSSRRHNSLRRLKRRCILLNRSLQARIPLYLILYPIYRLSRLLCGRTRSPMPSLQDTGIKGIEMRVWTVSRMINIRNGEDELCESQSLYTLYCVDCLSRLVFIVTQTDLLFSEADLLKIDRSVVTGVSLYDGHNRSRQRSTTHIPSSYPSRSIYRNWIPLPTTRRSRSISTIPSQAAELGGRSDIKTSPTSWRSHVARPLPLQSTENQGTTMILRCRYSRNNAVPLATEDGNNSSLGSAHHDGSIDLLHLITMIPTTILSLHFSRTLHPSLMSLVCFPCSSKGL